MIGVAKSNYAEAPQPIQYHRARDKAIEYLGPSPISLDAALNAKPSAAEDDRGPNQTEKAEAWLLDFMDGKPVSSASATKAAKDEGFSEPTLRRARKSLGIIARKQQDGWEWHPPMSEVA